MIKLTMVLLTALLHSFAHAGELIDRYDPDCLPLFAQGRHGPFNYNTATPAEKNLVEGTHFDEHYQAYRLGKQKLQKKKDYIIETPAAGFSYTLWAFPNHAPALAAMEDLGFKQKLEKLPGAELRVHCYFQRAVKLAPDDPLVRSIYGYYYARRGKGPEANEQLAKAESLGEENMSVMVYAAFAYLELKEYDKALSAAKAAYQLGYSLPGLRNRLEKAGKWTE